MSQFSKTSGKLWAAMAGEVSEDVILSEYSAFVSLVIAQAESAVFENKRYSDNISYLKSDILQLRECAKQGIKLSNMRDTTATPVKYARIMSSVMEYLQQVLIIAVKWNFIEFEDNTRFGSYRGEK